MNNPKHLPARIEECLKATGMRQNDLATILGVYQSHISRVLNGDVGLSRRRLQALADLWGYTVEEFVAPDPLPHPPIRPKSTTSPPPPAPASGSHLLLEGLVPRLTAAQAGKVIEFIGALSEGRAVAALPPLSEAERTQFPELQTLLECYPRLDEIDRDLFRAWLTSIQSRHPEWFDHGAARSRVAVLSDRAHHG